MYRGKLLLSLSILLLTVFMVLPSWALEFTSPVQPPPDAPCPQVSGYFDAPGESIDCADPYCGRLIWKLRHAAQTRDAREILIQSAFEYYVIRHPEILHQYPGFPVYTPSNRLAQGLADLSVTGREAYSSFRRLNLSEADLVAPLEQLLRHIFTSHQVDSGDLTWSVGQAVQRAYRVAWALRGPVPHRQAQRPGLGWIAVSAEDDPPHRPVNVPSAAFPQFNMSLQVQGHSVDARYIVASRHITDDHPVDLNSVPPERQLPLIIGDIILFIHGHSSRLEEAMSLIEPVLNQGENRGRPVTLIAFDLPSNGYSSMIEHENIASWTQSNWNTGYPVLQFIEDFIVAFANGLEAQQPGISRQIVGVIGGSLGGNMTLRLGQRSSNAHPWLQNLVSWSPASSWDSLARATLLPNLDPGREWHISKHEMVRGSRDKMREPEEDDSRHKFFYDRVLFVIKVGFMGQSDHWYSPTWSCAPSAVEGALRSTEEIYNPTFRRWHWRVAHEQIIFSHRDSNNTDSSVDPDPRLNPDAGPARYSLIGSRLLLAAGTDDNINPEKLYDNTLELGALMTMVNGSTLFLENTGHSIHVERPNYFSDRVIQFLFESPPPPFPYFLMTN